ncbi:hypothetical protein AR688_08035 [Rheinheimera sp. EpRS3]|nr:hypothetical protein AR688_08035 [Rheinheimera sp. EpRS3]
MGLVAANRPASVQRYTGTTQAFSLVKFIYSINIFFIASGYLDAGKITSLMFQDGLRATTI